MFDLPPLPMAREQDVEDTREHAVNSEQPVVQERIVPADETGNGVDLEDGGSKVDPLRSLPEIPTMPENASDNKTMMDGTTVKIQRQDEPSDSAPDCEITSTRNLRSRTKHQKNTVESGEQKLKVSKAEAGSDEKQQANLEDRFRSCQSELEDRKKELAESKKALEKIKNQKTKARKDLSVCRQDLRKSDRSNHDLERANEKLHGDLKTSQEELLKCKDDLFSLQKVAQDPDSIISNQFECMVQQIAHWVDGQLAAFEKAHPETEPDQIFSAGEEKTTADFLRRYPDAGNHLARNLIHCLLDLYLFDRERYLFGMPGLTKQMLQEVEHEMAKLDPPRDSVAIASWRSETLKAFAETTEYGICCQRESQDLNFHLLKELFHLFPALYSGPQTYDTFYQQGLLPAVEFANMIRKSTYKYEVSVPKAHTTRSEPVTTDSLKWQKMVDYKSGRHLKANSAVIADKDGVIGNVIICLAPALFRVIEGKEKLLLQGTALVELNQPLPKRIKTAT